MQEIIIKKNLIDLLPDKIYQLKDKTNLLNFINLTLLHIFSFQMPKNKQNLQVFKSFS